MNAYDVMAEWDRVTGNGVRSKEQLDKDVPPDLGNWDYEVWKSKLEAKDVRAIIAGMRAWGLPVEALGPFELDAEIPTEERDY